MSQPIKAGIRQLVAIQPDKLDGLTEDVGPLAIEEVVGQFAGLIAETRQANDLFGRFGDGTFVLLMERGTQRDVEIWANNLIKQSRRRRCSARATSRRPARAASASA